MRRWKVFTVIALLIVTSVFMTGCQSWQREMKSLRSDLNGGLNRTVTVYTYDGVPIKSWSGKFDVSASENEVYFDLNDKRTIIHGGIVINEEN